MNSKPDFKISFSDWTMQFEDWKVFAVLGAALLIGVAGGFLLRAGVTAQAVTEAREQGAREAYTAAVLQMREFGKLTFHNGFVDGCMAEKLHDHEATTGGLWPEPEVTYGSAEILAEVEAALQECTAHNRKALDLNLFDKRFAPPPLPLP